MIKKTVSKLTSTTWLVLVVLLVVLGLEVYITTLIPEGRKLVFGSLSSKSWDGFVSGMWFYSTIFLSFGVVQGVKGYLANSVSAKVREAMTKVVLKRWVKQEDLTKLDHPSQRINEDIRICTESTLEVGLEVFISAAIVITLVSSMWSSQALLLWAAVGYTALSVIIALVFNKPLKNRDIGLQVAEAAHREAIHKIELGLGDYTAKSKLVSVITEYMKYAKVKLMYSMFYKITMGFSSIVPLFLLAGPFFADTINLGQLMEGGSQFELVVINLGILLTVYGSVIKAQASWHRVIRFYKEI